MARPYKFVADGIVVSHSRWCKSDTHARRLLARYARFRVSRDARLADADFDLYFRPTLPCGTIACTDAVKIRTFVGAAATEQYRR